MALPPGVRPVRAADGVIVVSRPRVLRPRPTERSNAVRAALSSAACHRSTLSRTLVRMTSFPHHFPHRPVALAAGARGTSGIRRRRWSLSAGALAVPAPWPAAGPTLAFLQLLLGPANAAFSGHLLLGILDPADELVSGQRRDVLPSIERRRVGDQRLAQVFGKLVHHPTGHSLAAHTATVAVQGPGLFANSAAPIADARRGPLFESEGLDDGEVASEMPRVMERRRAVLASSCATAWPRVWTCPGMAAAVTAASRRRRRSPRQVP